MEAPIFSPYFSYENIPPFRFSLLKSDPESLLNQLDEECPLNNNRLSFNSDDLQQNGSIEDFSTDESSSKDVFSAKKSEVERTQEISLKNFVNIEESDIMDVVKPDSNSSMQNSSSHSEEVKRKKRKRNEVDTENILGRNVKRIRKEPFTSPSIEDEKKIADRIAQRVIDDRLNRLNEIEKRHKEMAEQIDLFAKLDPNFLNPAKIGSLPKIENFVNYIVSKKNQ